MGSGGSKETNRQLAEQRAQANALAGTLGGRGTEQYGQQEDIRDYLLGEYKGLYSGLGEGGGGGGGGGRGGGKLNQFWQNMLETGGYSDEDKANILSYATGPISGLFEGLQRNLQTQAAGRGLPSYSSGLSRIARDQAYQTGEMAKGVSADLAEKILQGKMQGANKLEQMRRSTAASRNAASSNNERLQLEYLSRIQGLMPSDLPYVDRQMGALGLGTQAAGMRQSETPAWQQALASVVPAAAGSAIGAFTGKPGGGGLQMPSPGSSPLMYRQDLRY